MIGTLGAVPKDLVRYLSTIGADKITPVITPEGKTILITANILRKYM